MLVDVRHWSRAASAELGERSGTRMLLATRLVAATATHARSPCAHDAAGCLIRTGPARGRRPAKTAWKAHVAVAWVVSLSVHCVVLAALGCSLPGPPVTRWIAVAPGQASIALLASPGAEFVAAKPAPALPEPRRPAEEPPKATPVELAPQAETVVRRSLCSFHRLLERSVCNR